MVRNHGAGNIVAEIVHCLILAHHRSKDRNDPVSIVLRHALLLDRRGERRHVSITTKLQNKEKLGPLKPLPPHSRRLCTDSKHGHVIERASAGTDDDRVGCFSRA